ncbi:ATP-binding protein [Cohnella sp. GCM10012308]|uniref:ATP-binding protein n=1 Tax=Cohnella sp. GCM10012308 TaxID=3317329 RepID=UPI00361C7B5A
MDQDLVRYSRAGDVFHYRWAARRCLRMISPKSLIRHIFIEGSKEREMAGEYVIDVSEYINSLEGNLDRIFYYQLKHTTVRKDQSFNLSDLKGTIEGFAKRYNEHIKDNLMASVNISFVLVSNRPVSEKVKENIKNVISGDQVDKRFLNTLSKYVNLQDDELKKFCLNLEFADSEGDYNVQKHELRVEISQLLAGTVNNSQINHITSLVQEKALPHNKEPIVREEVLRYFEVTSERELFPAPPEFEELREMVPRVQYNELLNLMMSQTSPVIVHASGGIGKTVFARTVVKMLPTGSIGIIYDCFGGGRYRNRSEHRHQHSDALVQIVNELAAQGLCDPLIVQHGASEKDIMRKFLDRLTFTLEVLKKTKNDAQMIILLDAADNAEMAAAEVNEPCFVHELMRESIPEGCILVALCRTERIHLLRPKASIPQFELPAFSEEESLLHLRSFFSHASHDDGQEFHRLTSANPRVQANALNAGHSTLTEVLKSLGPSGTTVEDQISNQLDIAIATVVDRHPQDYQKYIESICSGLATLPPFIPLDVLAAAAETDKATVRSFVADLGRPLWISDTSVQFRDEPTETWFREKFAASKELINSYVDHLRPLAAGSSYVATALPSLLLQSGNYDELMDLALSDRLLPQNNPIDVRSIRLYRLQFAYKAALRQERYADAIKLAVRAGEETAGMNRQLQILRKNVDLIAPLQSVEKVQEYAFRRSIRGKWDGSSNIYSASLLATVPHLKGEARGYIRAAHNWLRLYFEERRKRKEEFNQERLEYDDIVELANAHFHLFGIEDAAEFLLGWSPNNVTYRITGPFVKRLIDAGKLEVAQSLIKVAPREQYLVIATVHELLKVGYVPHASCLKESLILLTSDPARIPRPEYAYNDTTLSAIVSFLEVCAANKLPKEQILRVLRHYSPERAPMALTSNHQSIEREAYLRAVALKCALLNNFELDINNLIPSMILEERKGRNFDQSVQEFKGIVGRLLPWYFVRIRILLNDYSNMSEAIENANSLSTKAHGQRYQGYDAIPYEISRVKIEVLMYLSKADTSQVNQYFVDHLKENRQILIQDRIGALRSAIRNEHLSGIKINLEQAAINEIISDSSLETETRAELLIDLARAVLSADMDDAAVYFNDAIEAVSKFGDEIVERWMALVALANRSAESEHVSPEHAYRFIRCAELIGENVVREKHWDRNGAIEICVRLNPHSALAALSRWRDREVGWFDRQLPALAEEIVISKSISPSVAWSLSAFFVDYGIAGFAELCIENEQDEKKRQSILEAVINDLELSEASETNWSILERVARKHSMKSDKLDKIIAFHAENHKSRTEKKVKNDPHTVHQSEQQTNFENIFDSVELTSYSGIQIALNRFNEATARPYNRRDFWNELYSRVDNSDAVKVLNEIVLVDCADIYDIQAALSTVPQEWMNKVSVKRIWSGVLEDVARRFAYRFTERGTLDFFVEKIYTDEHTKESMQKGIFEGLSTSGDLINASTFFGFAQMASSLISPEEAKGTLAFALSRFELHVDDEFADGPWSDWLVPPLEKNEAFAGFIWAALGSPRAEIRWRAAHAVRRLAALDCEAEIDALILWLERNKVDAYGNNKLPFYSLHARLYLLIAIARVSISKPSIIKKHHAVFLRHALGDFVHVLIQKFSSEVALNIERAYPGTYNGDTVEQLNKVGVSSFPIKNVGYNDLFDSYWHRAGLIDKSLKFHHGYDFDSYWFEPLGDVFGLKSKQVEELATEVIVKEWRIKNDNDPRAALWRSEQNGRGTWHSHYSYPHIDNYRFYLSYHSMFVVAAKVLEKMPIVHQREWRENEWGSWLERHVLTRKDGYWLSDRRDPVPLFPREWLLKSDDKNWKSEVSTYDFFDEVVFERDGEIWLNVYGSRDVSDSERKAHSYVTSALVLPEGSQSLMNALIACSSPHDFKLPEYQEEDMEFTEYPFELKGWVLRSDTSAGLDRFDPLAADIDFPPYVIGQTIVEKMNLTCDYEQRMWFSPESNDPCVNCEIWSASRSVPDQDPSNKGNRLSASLSFLRKVCSIFKCEIIFEVQIDREYKQKPYTRREHSDEYTPPRNKLFILSADGRLRSSESYYEFGKGVSH